MKPWRDHCKIHLCINESIGDRWRAFFVNLGVIVNFKSEFDVLWKSWANLGVNETDDADNIKRTASPCWADIARYEAAFSRVKSPTTEAVVLFFRGHAILLWFICGEDEGLLSTSRMPHE